MSKGLTFIILGVIGSILCAVSIFMPNVLTSRNSFVADFFGADILALQGTLMSITFAAAALLKLEFVRLAKNKPEIISRIERKLLYSVNAMAVLFLISLMLLIIRDSIFDENALYWSASLNSFLISSIVCYVLIMVDVARAILRLR